jgi:hypothetical protein
MWGRHKMSPRERRRQADIRLVWYKRDSWESWFYDRRIVQYLNLNVPQNILYIYNGVEMLKCFKKLPSPYCMWNRISLKCCPYRVEDKCICRRRAAIGAWLGKEALGPKGSPLLLLLSSPWCGPFTCCCSNTLVCNCSSSCRLLDLLVADLQTSVLPSFLAVFLHHSQPSLPHSSHNNAERSIFPGPVHQ